MRALHVPAAGQQPQLSELPVPEPGAGQVLIQVKAAGLNALDNALAAGMMAQMLEHLYPLVLGRDASGVVVATGEGVTDISVGQPVFGHVLLAPPVQAGTLAEYALLPAASTAAKPADLDWVTAAALPLAGAAASAAVDAVAPKPGDVVLLVGAGGGVGSYATQLLAARGAVVLATGTSADAARLKRLGASAVIDYTTGSVADQVRSAYPEGIDAVIDLVAYSPDGLPVTTLRKGGKVVSSLGAANDELLAADGLTGTNIMAMPTSDVISALAADVVDGALKVDVETILPLANAADGLAAIAGGQARGKIVVEVDA